MEHSAVIVFCTVPNQETASTIARALLNARFAACIQLVPSVRSLYLWEGAIADEQEIQMVIKTSRRHVPAVEHTISELHPYKVPEVLTVAVEGGSTAYLKWLEAETSR